MTGNGGDWDPWGPGRRGNIISGITIYYCCFCFNGVILRSWAVSQQFTCSGCMLGNLYVSPLNSDMDYRIFNANMWSFCMCIKIVYSFSQRTFIFRVCTELDPGVTEGLNTPVWKVYISVWASTHLYGRYSISEWAPTHLYGRYSISEWASTHLYGRYSISVWASTHLYGRYSISEWAPTHLYGRDGEYLREGLNSMLLGDFIPRHGQGSQHLQSATRQVTAP